MSDQADTLRRLMSQRQVLGVSRGSSLEKVYGNGPAVFTFASGKGGVGKSCLTANLGTVLARAGLRVLLVDGDMGLANLDILLGAQATATLEQVLDGECTIQQAIVGLEPNLWLIPASAGLMEVRTADVKTRKRFLSLLERCPWEMDVVLVDIGSGIQHNVLSMHHAGFESTVVLTPEPTSMTDAYSLIKILRRQIGLGRVNIIVNQVTDGREGVKVFQKLKDVAGRFVDVELDYLGHCQRDEKITQSVMKRKILLDLDSGAPSIPSLELLAKRIRAKCQGRIAEMPQNSDVGRPLTSGRFQDEPAQRAPGNTAGFWRTLLGEVNA